MAEAKKKKVTVKNNGTRYVHVGHKVLMPGEEITVAAQVADTPAIAVLVKSGKLTVTPVADEQEETVEKKTASRKKTAAGKKTTAEKETTGAEEEQP